MEVSTLMVGWGFSYAQIRDAFLEAESLGYDACYVGDDLFPHPVEDEGVFDPWTLLPAMAQITSSMRIGSLVSPAGRRNPYLFGKMTTGCDIISGGRLTVGLGAGNIPEQQGRAGQTFSSPAERAQLVREEATILKRLWTQRRTEFAGDHYSIADAINEPKPVRQGGPELMFGMKSAKYMTAIAAELADRVNVFGADSVKARAVLDTIDDHCRTIGRNPAEIVRGRLGTIHLKDGPVRELDDEVREIGRLVGESLGQRNRCDLENMMVHYNDWCFSFIGSAEDCVEAIKRDVFGSGFTEIVICIDTIGTNSYARTMAGLRDFAARVMPALKIL